MRHTRPQRHIQRIRHLLQGKVTRQHAPGYARPRECSVRIPGAERVGDCGYEEHLYAGQKREHCEKGERAEYKNRMPPQRIPQGPESLSNRF